MGYSSAVVLAGANFDRSTFNAEHVFGEELDRHDIVMAGSIGDFRYASGTYRFSVTPERISVEHSDGLLSGELVDAAGKVVRDLMRLPKHNVTGMGLNVNATFDQAIDGPAGVDFCAGMVNVDSLSELFGYEPRYALPRVVFLRAGVQYDVRLEPHFSSGGANLFLHVNAHQNVGPQDRLEEKLDGVSHVRPYVEALCRKIQAEFGAQKS